MLHIVIVVSRQLKSQLIPHGETLCFTYAVDEYDPRRGDQSEDRRRQQRMRNALSHPAESGSGSGPDPESGIMSTSKYNIYI